MEKIAVYTLTSSLHDAAALDKASEKFLKEIFPEGGFDLKGADYSDFGTHLLDLIYVRTGGTEGVFLKLLPTLKKVKHFHLLTSGSSNSLAASMEILSYLGQNGMSGEIIHGKAETVTKRIEDLKAVSQAKCKLQGQRLGVLGHPSDWLISSTADYSKVKAKLGIELVDVPMAEVKAAVDEAEPEALNETPEIIGSKPALVKDSIPGAMKIHAGLQKIVRHHNLSGFTIRCFDLLTAIGNTGCLSLATFNAQGIPAGCEGDVPALLSMTVARALTGRTGFMANPSRIDPDSGRMVFAHCTVPFDIVDKVQFDTHFESGIGVGIRGHIPEGPVTVFKLSGDLTRIFAAEGTIERNLEEPSLCRTQIEIKLDDPSLMETYFLTNPIGNHHIIVPGRHAAALKALLK